MIGRALTLALCAAALWGATAVAGAATGAVSTAGGVVGAQGWAILAADEARPAAPPDELAQKADSPLLPQGQAPPGSEGALGIPA